MIRPGTRTKRRHLFIRLGALTLRFCNFRWGYLLRFGAERALSGIGRPVLPKGLMFVLPVETARKSAWTRQRRGARH
jgi:hypothetical protein